MAHVEIGHILTNRRCSTEDRRPPTSTTSFHVMPIRKLFDGRSNLTGVQFGHKQFQKGAAA